MQAVSWLLWFRIYENEAGRTVLQKRKKNPLVGTKKQRPVKKVEEKKEKEKEKKGIRVLKLVQKRRERERERERKRKRERERERERKRKRKIQYQVEAEVAEEKPGRRVHLTGRGGNALFLVHQEQRSNHC